VSIATGRRKLRNFAKENVYTKNEQQQYEDSAELTMILFIRQVINRSKFI
jgi:hypothetical protein